MATIKNLLLHITGEQKISQYYIEPTIFTSPHTYSVVDHECVDLNSVLFLEIFKSKEPSTFS